MKYRRLPDTDIDVSVVCLGTMTWGEQNTEAEAREQLDLALEAGVNFIDTAEMYPIPPRGETYTRTETYIGNWLRDRGGRDKVVLATKVVGRSARMAHIRGGPCLDRANIETAIDGSLRRLQTDYVDLYQLHWPDRHTNFFGTLGYTHHPGDDGTPIEETLKVLGDLVQAGKVRHIGLSNETPWGIMRFLQAAKELGLPRVVTVQNPYNLLNRTFEIGNAEVSHRENVGLLAYSPMGFGVLSGKYLDGERPAGARLTLFQNYGRYSSPESVAATAEYVHIAREAGLDPAQMALAFVHTRPFLTTTIVGATSIDQLRSDIDSIDVELETQVLDRIDAVHRRYPNPAP